jgi:hypothetical protein
VRWVEYRAFQKSPEQPIAGLVQFQERTERPIVIVPPAAARAAAIAERQLSHDAPDSVLRAIEQAERELGAVDAPVFRGVLEGRRALALGLQGRYAAADSAERRSLRWWTDNPDAHMANAILLAEASRPDEAARELEHVLRLEPEYPHARELLELLARGRGRR